MVAPTNRQRLASVAAGFLGVGLAVAIGAGQPTPTVAPRYTVQYAVALTLITDNQTNKLYIYENTGHNSELRQMVDLNSAGKPELAGTKAKPKES
jgi:hypothetical protein